MPLLVKQQKKKIPLTISSLSPKKGGTNGGVKVTIIGSGFPISK